MTTAQDILAGPWNRYFSRQTASGFRESVSKHDTLPIERWLIEVDGESSSTFIHGYFECYTAQEMADHLNKQREKLGI